MDSNMNFENMTVTDRNKASPYDKWAQMNLEHTNDWIVLTKKTMFLLKFYGL